MNGKLVKIDVDSVLRTRLPKHYRYIPRFVVRWLERTICQDRLNTILKKMADKNSVDAATAALDEMGINVTASGLDELPDGRYMFVSNHPLGGLDGLALISLLGNRYDHKIKFLVNDLLMNLPGLAPLCIPINTTTKKSRSFPQLIEAGFQGDYHLLMFPAGLCSRRRKDVICDLPWKKTFITKSVECQRDVVPIFFGGRNSDFFYRLSNFSDRYVKKINIAMLFLVDEMYKNRGNTFHVKIGKPIPWQTFDQSKTPQQWAEYVKEKVYSL